MIQMAIENERAKEREISQGIERTKEETERLSQQVKRKTINKGLQRKQTGGR